MLDALFAWVSRMRCSFRGMSFGLGVLTAGAARAVPAALERSFTELFTVCRDSRFSHSLTMVWPQRLGWNRGRTRAEVRFNFLSADQVSNLLYMYRSTHVPHHIGQGARL